MRAPNLYYKNHAYLVSLLPALLMFEKDLNLDSTASWSEVGVIYRTELGTAAAIEIEFPTQSHQLRI